MMGNFELIDDYLANRLNEADKAALEQQLAGDPALKDELEFQKTVVEGVRRARMLELKSMLNNAPIGGTSWGGAAKVAAAVVSAGVVVTSLYFYLNDAPETSAPAADQSQPVITAPENNSTEQPAPEESKPTAGDEARLDSKSASEPKGKKGEQKSPSPVRKPDFQVVDPSEELSAAEEKPEVEDPGHANISASKMEVVTGIVDKKHNFHYQFVQGKLLLYGPFDESLYEILEIHGEDHAVFLFYKDNYYLLDQKQSKVKELEAIKDGQLLKRLKEYRGQ